MHQHDFDLIAALAEGTLGEDAASAASAEIASCAECSSELAAQRTALGAVAAAVQPGLTMAESASLRRGVEAALGRAPVVTETQRRRPWMALVTAGAVVVVLAAISPLVNLLSTDSSADDVASETTIASTAARESLTADTAAPPTEAPATAAPATSSATAEAPVAAEDGAADVGEAESLAGDGLPDLLLSFRATTDLDQFLSDVAGGVEELDRIRVLTPDEIAYFQSELEAGLVDRASECPTEDILAEVEGAIGLTTVGTTSLDEQELLVVIVAAEDGTQTVVALDSTSCAVVGVSSGG